MRRGAGGGADVAAGAPPGLGRPGTERDGQRKFWPKCFSAHTWLIRAYSAMVIFIKCSSVEYLYSIIYSLAVKETKANTNLVQKFKVCHLFSYCI